LFEGGLQVFDDFLSENIGIGEVVGFFETFIPEPEDVETGFVAVNEFSLVEDIPTTLGYPILHHCKT
jgi:hypothetical protein